MLKIPFLLKSLQKEREQTVFCGKLNEKEWIYIAGGEILTGFQGSEILGQTAWECAEPPVLQSSKGSGRSADKAWQK